MRVLNCADLVFGVCECTDSFVSRHPLSRELEGMKGDMDVVGVDITDNDFS